MKIYIKYINNYTAKHLMVYFEYNCNYSIFQQHSIFKCVTLNSFAILTILFTVLYANIYIPPIYMPSHLQTLYSCIKYFPISLFLSFLFMSAGPNWPQGRSGFVRSFYGLSRLEKQFHNLKIFRLRRVSSAFSK